MNSVISGAASVTSLSIAAHSMFAAFGSVSCVASALVIFVWMAGSQNSDRLGLAVELAWKPLQPNERRGSSTAPRSRGASRSS